MTKLTPKQQRFVEEYIADLNATQAYIRTGYQVKNKETAAVMASRLLRNNKVQEAIKIAQNKLSERTGITQDTVLKRLWHIATANPNELIKYVRVNCRYCWGIDHYYQWTKAEHHIAIYSAKAEDLPPPDCGGGFDFNKTKAPNPECPECQGQGYGYVTVSDTTRVSDQAKMLYAGIKETQHGIEIKMHDQMNALIKVGQHIGMFNNKVEVTGKNKVEVTGKNGKPIQTANLNINMSEEEINQRIVELLVKLGISNA